MGQDGVEHNGLTKKHAPATLRNRDSILSVLERWLPDQGLVLEIAAGSGEHAAFFAPLFPHLQWQPSDPDPDCLASIAAHGAESGANNLRPAMALDVRMQPWPIPPGGADAVFCSNMIHIAPPACTAALIEGAACVLRPLGVLILYGPFTIDHRHTAPSNAEFNQWLMEQNPDWGLRDLGDVGEMAQKNGLDHLATAPMPANNLAVVWRKRP